jgi:hypothetical protein
MKVLLYFCCILTIVSSFGRKANAASLLSENDIQKADDIARETASWFEYTTGSMNSEHLGQCSDYAVMFVIRFNEYAGKNLARLVIANNPVPSGTYRVGDKTDVARLGFSGFESGASNLF